MKKDKFQLQKASIEAKAKVASEVEKQNELTAEQNKLAAQRNRQASAKTVMKSNIATDEQKKRAMDVLMGFIEPNTSTS